MKTSYIFGAIAACGILGALIGHRAAKTALLLVSALLAVYGLLRVLGLVHW
jgi:hypothetical protein